MTVCDPLPCADRFDSSEPRVRPPRHGLRPVLLGVVALAVSATAWTQEAENETRGSRRIEVRTAGGDSVANYLASHSLLIGASDYERGWDDLDSVPDELERVRRKLVEHDFEVRVVLDPDSRELEDAFEEFLDDYGFDEGNRLLIYFAGHGYTRKTDQGLRGYLVPVDAPDPDRDKRGFLRSAFSMSRVELWARRAEVRHLLVLFDSCFSGTILRTRSRRPQPPPHITAKTGKKARQFITAGSADEPVPAESYFAPAFIRALDGAGDLNDDGYVTGLELASYLHDHLVDANVGQTPQFGIVSFPRLDDGDFVFELPAREPSELAIAEPPEVPRTSFSDLQELASRRRRWGAFQEGMSEAYSSVENLDAMKELTPAEKVEAWTRFLSDFEADNPLSEEDDQQRFEARQRIVFWDATQAAEQNRERLGELVDMKGRLDYLRASRAEKLDLTAAFSSQDATRRLLDAEIEVLEQQILEASDRFLTEVVDFLNQDPPVVGEPLTETQRVAVRLKSSEDMILAREWIELGGDYQRAIAIYENALALDPDNEELQAALAEAQRLRYMSAERFEAVRKGMTTAEVRAVLGTPLIHNVKTYEDRGVTAWFYLTAESGSAAAVWFRGLSEDQMEVYLATYDAVPARE